MPSNHVNAGLLIRCGLYDNLRSFAELEHRISALGDENTKTVGDAFEVFVEGYLATHQKLQAEAVWLVGQVPQFIRQQLNLPNDAKGIDGVFRTRTGVLVPYQVKFRSQRAYLTYTQIAPFLGLTERATDRIVFTNSNELAEDVKNRDAMRTVRGIDFDDLTEDDLRAITAWLREQPVAIKKPNPRDYQIEALAKISDALARSDRAHVVMACATGKTLIALWAAEALKPKTVLVLLPSLTLLQQTLDEWSRHNIWGNDFTYLCVCSDPTVAARDATDPVRLDATDLEFRVDTNPEEVRRFIERDTRGVKVVFSTYQSSWVVSLGVHGLAPFDVAIFDEAHKTTGPQGGLFAHSLKDENIRIRKRLFFTATPRHYDIRHRDKEGDFRIISMDDEAIYGPRAYTLTFGSAARQGIICNYKVVISVVDGHEVNEFALKYGITLVEGDLIGARWVANQIAVERAVEKTGAKRAITFHSRVSSAKQFSAEGTQGIRQYLPEFSVFHVNGDQKSSTRKQIIRSFRDASEALITNARCLTEGIDVPAVDMVAFIDPRRSRIDIAQATGRAMRKPGGSDKEVGYVVIPLFLDRRSGETFEEALERSEFDDVATVLNAMQEQDEDLVQVIREIQEAKGRGEVFNPSRLSEKFEIFGPSIEFSSLRSNIFAEIVNAIGVSWDQWYGRLTLYKDREGHCTVPVKYITPDGSRLGSWVSRQRLAQDELSDERKARLEALGFVWDPVTRQWEEGFERLQAYAKEYGNCRVPPRYKTPDGYRLGGWVMEQRHNRDSRSPERKARLDALGFDWGPRDTTWEEGFVRLQAYVNENSDCRVPRGYKSTDGFELGQWVSNWRQKRTIISPERKERLDAMNFDWDPYDTAWGDGLEHFRAFVNEHKHGRVSQQYRSPDGFELGTWVSKRRLGRKSLRPEQTKLLDSLGFVWDPIKIQWEEGVEHLHAYVKEHGDCRVPSQYKSADGFKLGIWAANRRGRRDMLTPEQIEILDALGFEWDPIALKWEKGFEHLQAYVKQYKNCRVPMLYKSPDGFNLGRWVDNMRQIPDSVSPERKARLDALGFDWGPRTTQWEQGLHYLKGYKEREGHCRVPQTHREAGFALGVWVNTQRQASKPLSDERRQRLDELGFVWKVRRGRGSSVI